MLKLKARVTLSKESLYARPPFQVEGRGHLKVGEVGVVTKVLDELEVGCYVVKFKDGKSYTTNTYREAMLVKLDK